MDNTTLKLSLNEAVATRSLWRAEKTRLEAEFHTCLQAGNEPSEELKEAYDVADSMLRKL